MKVKISFLMMKKYFYLLNIGLFFLFTFTNVQANNTDNERYQQALLFAKTKDYGKSIQLFKALRLAYPQNITYLSDYVQILATASKDEAVLNLAKEVPFYQVRAYVLEAIARSAKNLKKYQQSQFFYNIVIQRFPQRIEAYIGLALVFVDQGKTQEALKLLLPLVKKHPKHSEILFTLAYTYEMASQFFKALTYYDKVLILNDTHHYALKRRILVISKLGIPSLAYRMTKDIKKTIFSDDEIAHIRWDNATYWIRWGAIGNAIEENLRFDDLDNAINKLTQNIAYAKTLKNSHWKNKARFDLIIALRNRIYMQQAIAEAEKLLARNIELPTHVMIALADAYLYLEQPELAKKVYLDALQQSPKSFSLRLSLFYAYLEAENYNDSEQMIKALVSEQALRQVKKYYNPQTKKFKILSKGNPNKTQAESVLALSNAYFGDLQTAEKHAKFLSDSAPHNQDLRANLGTIYYWRGWARRAQEEYEMGINIEPKNIALKIALARNWLELKYYQQAEKQIKTIYFDYPENKYIQKQYNLWGIHNDPELIVNVNGSESRGAQQNGSRGLTIDSYLYSSPINYNFRAFAHYRWTKATFSEGVGQTHHQGLGLEYTHPDLKLTAEIHHNNYANNKIGLSVGGDYDFNDQWRINALFESFSHQTPLRALKNDIDAQSISLSTTFRQHESREISLNGNYLNFSDGNQRYSLNSAYFQRWYSGAIYKFATYTNLFYSQNSQTNVPYFSPSRQAAAEITLDHDWLSYQHYDTSWHQRLSLTVGQSWQQGFGDDFIYSLAYQHRWKAFNRIEFIYGTNYGKRFYDGNKEYSWQYFARLNWRF
jgi:biofilm PGA synthesis protein PgaA